MEHFDTVWPKIKMMRGRSQAPVDTMGCDRIAAGHNPSAHRFQILISLLLSSQTKDHVTYTALCSLQRHFHNRLDCAAICGTDVKVIEKCIYPVGFYRRKAEYLKAIADRLQAECNGDIPDDFNALVRLPGIGPKMAHLIMLAAWGIVSGIAVDVHVHRITARLGWVEKVNDPEKARIALEAVIPRDKWAEINHLLVGFGQTVCSAKNPSCSDCAVSNWCKFYKEPW